MTINCLKNMGIKVQGIIFNKIEKNFDRTGYENDNIKVIQDMSGIKNMMILDFEQESFDQEELIRFLELREEEK
jgi:dethiobiotin synthetase